MTSKEYLKQIATTEVIDCTYNDNSKKRIADIFSVGISVIEKDLEVLEMLKAILYRITDYNDFNLSFTFYLNFETYNKIKEY